MMNIFLAFIAVLFAQYAVERSFQPTSHTVSKIKISNTNKFIKNAIASNKLIEVKAKNNISPKQKNPEKLFQSKAISKLEKKISYKSVDFTPVEKIQVKAPIVTTRVKTKFKNLPKKKVQLPKIKNEKITFKKTEINKSNVNKIELELSMNEISAQQKFVVKKLEQIAWSDNKIDFKKYEKLEIAKSDSRISPPETSITENNNEPTRPVDVNFNQKVTKLEDKNLQEDELIFFDYVENESKSDKVAPTPDVPTIEKEVAITNTPKIETKSESLEDTVLSTQSSILSQITKTGSTLPEAIQESKPTTPEAKPKKKTKKAIEIAKNDNNDRLIDPKVIDGFIDDNKKDEEAKNYACLKDLDFGDEQTYISNYNLKLRGIDYSQKGSDFLRNFDVRFHDDLNETIKDHGNGEVILNTKMSTQLSIRRASFYRSGYYPTTMDLVFEAGDLTAKVPVLSLDSFNSIVSKYELKAMGAHLLVELDDLTEDVELEDAKSYEYKLYLDKNLRVVQKSDSDFYFILFIGVKSGNNLAQFKHFSGSVITKIIHLAKDEIFYEPNFYAEVKKDQFFLYEESLLSNCYSLLNIKSNKISSWSHEAKFTKDSLNKYVISKMHYPLGIRKYYEFKHLEESIFVGRWSQESVVVPTEKYIDYVISQFDLSRSESKCVVQLNLHKPVSEIVFSGQSEHGLMDMQINILDSDGKFYKDFSPQSKRVFLMGENQGVINAKIDYTDGSTQFLQSYCSDSTYLVEQL